MLNLFLQIAGLVPPGVPPAELPPAFELTTIVDDVTVVDLAHHRAIQVLVRITNVDRKAHGLPFPGSFLGEVDLVDARDGQEYKSFWGCNGWGPRNVGRLVPACGFVDAMLDLHVTSALDDRAAREVRVRYRHERVEHLRTFDTPVRLYSMEPVEGPAFDEPAIEIFGPPFEIRRDDDADHVRRDRIQNRIRQVENGVWRAFEAGRLSYPAGYGPLASIPVRGVCVDAQSHVREILELGTHETADDALYAMGLATWIDGDLDASTVFFAALEIDHPLSTGAARMRALLRFGSRYARGSNGW